MKKAIVHEWFVDYAGSERCVESFLNIDSDFDLFALVAFPDNFIKDNILKDRSVNTSFIQSLPFAEKSFRNYLPLFPLAVEQFDLSSYDLILSSSHAVAKGALTNAKQLHISYCHTPIRYAWDLYHEYLNSSGLTKGIKGKIAKATLHYLRNWDIISSNRVDYFLANSHWIQRRIKKIYNRDSEVIYPPVDTLKFPFKDRKDNYYLTAGRFVPYKRFDLIAEAFSKMPDKKLLIIGDGPDLNRVKGKLSSNIDLIPQQPTNKLSDYMRNAKAFLFAAEEDFGITVVEALSAGTPVIAYSKGGTGETVKEGVNGVHFHYQNSDAIAEAVKKFESCNFNHFMIHQDAQFFSKNIFETKIDNFIKDKFEIFFNQK